MRHVGDFQAWSRDCSVKLVRCGKGTGSRMLKFSPWVENTGKHVSCTKKPPLIDYELPR